VVPKPDGQAAVEVEFNSKQQQYMSRKRQPHIFRALTSSQSAEKLSSTVLVKMRETAEQYLNKKIK
jgi:molecular chaperone DnaK